MSVFLTRSDGVTVLTLTSDPSSVCPPFCQLLGALCYSPTLCSRSRRLALPCRGSQAVLGALWIVSGLLQIGLGSVLLGTDAAGWQLRHTYCPVWLGVLFMGIGVSSVLTERYSSPCVLLVSAIFNVFGAVMSITAIVWYSIQLSDVDYSFYSMCDKGYYNHWRPTPSPSPQEIALQERCLEARQLLMVLVYSFSAVLLALAVLGLCVGISSAVFSFKALKPAKEKHGSKPLLEDDGTAPIQEE